MISSWYPTAWGFSDRFNFSWNCFAISVLSIALLG